MSIGNLGKPPVFVEDASDWAYKKWFNDVYRYTQSGILIPDGGQLSLPVYSTRKRNLIINGDFQVAQRGTGFVSNSTTPQWTFDRWAISTTTACQDVGRTALSGALPGFQFTGDSRRVAGNTSTAAQYLAQAIESPTIQALAGAPFVLSYWVNFGSSFLTYTQNQTSGSYTGKFQSTVETGTGVDEGVFAAFTGAKTVSLNLFSPTTAQLGTWMYVVQQGVIPTNAQEMKVYFQIVPSVAAGDVNAKYNITGVQLEIGYSPTAFEFQTFSESLLDCSRFYQKSFDYGTAAAQNTGIDAGVQTGVCVVASLTLKCDLDDTSLVPTMYKTPSVTYYCPHAATAKAWNYRAAAQSGNGVAQVNSSTKRIGTTVVLQTGGDTVDDLIGIHWDASADI